MKPLEENATVVGNKFWNIERGEGRVIELIEKNRVVIKWENEVNTREEYLLDVERKR